jgi:hypothetical protein
MLSENTENLGFGPNPFHLLVGVRILEDRRFIDFANPATAAMRNDLLDSSREILMNLYIRYVRHCKQIQLSILPASLDALRAYEGKGFIQGLFRHQGYDILATTLEKEWRPVNL